ncbi:hypothetical protein L207DRAFT_519567 [Hyaloscypha variabilis F]|uniref:DDE-1 domain-containing protein n=1 Tax=Hyaloscypha variabilis (strain UAMH 11265 / GT02V1 / F) TaxID=1149755 RepID=A0A2J6QYH7_HYAVF|nr:hypothetical protein L207DRAFT_519567 [Hyaloscypha variabilis F]
MVIEKYRITAENIYNFDEKGREFISCLACISAIGRWIPLLLVYKGESKDLLDTWVDGVETNSMAHFTTSHNGWSNNAIGLRLLIVDGHSSHVNMAINHLMDSTLSKVGMIKGLFWEHFKPVFDQAFLEANIQSAFRKLGIWPTDGTEIIKIITRGMRTPKSLKAIRHFQVWYDEEPTDDKVKKLFATALHLSAQGVRLNLCGEPNKGIIDCYSPAQVVKAREAANALKNKLEKEKKAKEKAEKKAKAEREKLVKELAAAAKKAQQAQPNPTTPRAKKAAPTVPKPPKSAPRVKAPLKLSSRRSVIVPAPSAVEVVVEARRTATRTITRPARFT